MPSRPTSWIVRMFGWFSDEAARASCSNRASPVRRGQVGPQHLDGDGATEPGVLGTVDLAHAARAKKRLEDVGAQASARGQWHDDGDYATRARPPARLR